MPSRSSSRDVFTRARTKYNVDSSGLVGSMPPKSRLYVVGSDIVALLGY